MEYVSDQILKRLSKVFHPSLSFCGFTKLNLNWSVLFFNDISNDNNNSNSNNYNDNNNNSSPNYILKYRVQ